MAFSRSCLFIHLRFFLFEKDVLGSSVLVGKRFGKMYYVKVRN